MRARWVLLCVLVLLNGGHLFVPVAAASDAMEWIVLEYEDPDEGSMTTQLLYAVPDSENVQVMAFCGAADGSGAKFSNFTFGTDVGDLPHETKATLRFSGGGFQRELEGLIQRYETAGLDGVLVEVDADDPLWGAFASKDRLDYLVPGYGASTLTFAPGRESIASFKEVCQGEVLN